MDTPENINEHPLTLTLDREALTYLEETRRWAYFLSVIGFIGIGCLVILGLLIGKFAHIFAASMPVNFNIESLSLVYYVIALVYLFPVVYMYKFATSMKLGLREMDHSKLNFSLKNLKSLFRFTGIVTLLIVGLYALIFLSFLAGMLMN